MKQMVFSPTSRVEKYDKTVIVHLIHPIYREPVCEKINGIEVSTSGYEHELTIKDPLVGPIGISAEEIFIPWNNVRFVEKLDDHNAPKTMKGDAGDVHD